MLVTGLESDLSGFDESNKLKLYVCQTSEDELMRLSRSNEDTVQFVSPYSSFIHRGRQNQQKTKGSCCFKEYYNSLANMRLCCLAESQK